MQNWTGSSTVAVVWIIALLSDINKLTHKRGVEHIIKNKTDFFPPSSYVGISL